MDSLDQGLQPVGGQFSMDVPKKFQHVPRHIFSCNASKEKLIENHRAVIFSRKLFGIINQQGDL